jgi:hypothetical protein
MTRIRELEALGAACRKQNGGYYPERVRRSGKLQRRKALKAFGDGHGWLARLAMTGSKLEHYTVHLKALGLEHLEDQESLYDHEAVNSIKQAIHEAVPGSFWAHLEVGDQARRLHIHVLAHNAPTVPYVRGKEKTLEEYANYLCKCQVPSDDLSAGIFWKAKQQARLEGKKRLPKTSFSRGIPMS